MFRDRRDAAIRLAEAVGELDLHKPLVLGIPRGGVVIGANLAERIGADLDVVLARKLRAPGRPELAVGAVSEDGKEFLNEVARQLNVSEDYLQQERRHQLDEIERRKQRFRAVKHREPVADRSVIVTDDGIATGATIMAALEVLRSESPREVIVAVPVAPAGTDRRLATHCDRVIILHSPSLFYAVGQFYEEFDQVSDEEVAEVLRAFARSQSAETGA